MAKNRFEDVTFKIVDEKMDEAIIDFMWKHFFPDEPISRSLKMQPNWFWNEGYLRDSLKNRASIVALDSTGQILGVRIAKVVDCSQWIPWLFATVLRFIATYLPFVFPKETKIGVFVAIFNKLEYDIYSISKKHKCNMIYDAKALCSGKENHFYRVFFVELF